MDLRNTLIERELQIKNYNDIATQVEIQDPEKFYKQHLQGLKLSTYTTEDLALLNQFGLIEFEERTACQLQHIRQL